MSKMKIAPSILTANFIRLEEEIKSVEEKSAYLHVDIMDGHFVPNISFGPTIAKQISNSSPIALDIHLMTEYPLLWIDSVNFPNTEFITIHQEAKRYKESLKRIKYIGKKAGLCIKPSTPVSAIYDDLKYVDLVLVMGVEPGFGGQVFIQSVLEKIKELALLKEKHDYTYEIEVDGGINVTTAKQCQEAGATILVAGSFIFNAVNRHERIEALK